MTVSWLQNVTELLLKWKRAWSERAVFSPGNKPTWRCCQRPPRCFCRARDKYRSRPWCRRPSSWDSWASRSIPATQRERYGHVWRSFRGKHALRYGKDAQTHTQHDVTEQLIMQLMWRPNLKNIFLKVINLLLKAGWIWSHECKLFFCFFLSFCLQVFFKPTWGRGVKQHFYSLLHSKFIL